LEPTPTWAYTPYLRVLSQRRQEPVYPGRLQAIQKHPTHGGSCERRGKAMTYHWYARYRLAQLMRQLTAHRALCADYQRRFGCHTCDDLRRRVKHYQRIEGAA